MPTTFADGEIPDAAKLNAAFAERQLVTDVTAKANVDSPSFTGTPTGPTAAPDDASTLLATTEFVTEADQRRVQYTGVLDLYDANTPPSDWPQAAATWIETGAGRGWPTDSGRVVVYRGKTLGADRARQRYMDSDGVAIYERTAIDAATWSPFQEVWGDWNTAPGTATQPALLNAWAGVAGFDPLTYYRDKFGRVWTAGRLASGTVGSAAAMLPVGFRPASQQTLYTISNDAIGKVTVKPTGEIIPDAPSSNVYVSFDGLSWLAGNCQDTPAMQDLMLTLKGDLAASYTRNGLVGYLINGIRVMNGPNEATFRGGRRVHNLLTASEDFTNAAWTAPIAGTGVAVAKTPNYASVADPAGGTSAMRLQFDRGTGLTTGDYSAFAQDLTYTLARGAAGVWLRTTATGATATLLMGMTGPGPAITVTNDWQRFQITMDLAASIAALTFDLRVDGTTQQTADVLFWHPQLEDQSEKTTLGLSEYLNSDSDYGVGINGMAYFGTDENGVALKTLSGFLAQPAHNNLIVASEDFTNASWVLSLYNVSATRFIRGPDRRVMWPKLIEDNVTNGNHIIAQTVTTGANQWVRFTWKMYLESGDRDTFRAQIYRSSNSAVIALSFTLSTKTGTLSAGGTDYTNGDYDIVADADGWVRITLWALDTVGGSTICRVFPLVSGSAAYVGDNTLGMNISEWDVVLDGTKPAIRTYVPSGNQPGSSVVLTLSNTVNPANMSLKFFFDPQQVMGLVYLISSEVDASNGTYILHDGANIIFRKRIAGVNYDASKPLAYTINTSYKIYASQTSSGMTISVDDVAGTGNTDTQPAKLASTMEIGGLNGGQQPLAYLHMLSLDTSNCGAIIAPAAAPSGPPPYNPDYPRIAGCNIGNKNYDDATYQAAMAKAHWVVLGFYYLWKTSYSYTAKDGKTYTGMRAAVKAIKDKNPNIMIGQYTILSDSPLDSNTATTWGTPGQVYEATDYKPEKLDAMTAAAKPWWLYKINADGTKSQATWSTSFGTYDVNITAYAAVDANGDRWSQWLPKQDNAIFFSPVPEFDIWYCDNVFQQCRVASADFNIDGVNETAASIAPQYRQGHADQWAQIRALQPNIHIIGNIDHDYSMPEFKNATVPLNGGMYEGAIGASYSLPLASAKTRYHGQVANVAAPKLIMFNGRGSATDYKTMRLTLCLTLMDDGYCFFGPDYNSLPWFDEYDNAGAGKGYLGQPVEGPALTALTGTVYRRKYTGGVAFVNIGTAAVNVTLDRNYKRITGVQDTTTNSGAALASGTLISIPATDGLILLNN